MNNNHKQRISVLARLRATHLRSVAILAVAVLFTGCSDLGYLLSNDKVTDADNNKVVFVGDSIFALSG